jgi:hypothetical protein
MMIEPLYLVRMMPGEIVERRCTLDCVEVALRGTGQFDVSAVSDLPRSAVSPVCFLEWLTAKHCLEACRAAVDEMQNLRIESQKELQFVALYGRMADCCRRRHQLREIISQLGAEQQRTREVMQQLAFHSVELLQLEKRIGEVSKEITELFPRENTE